MKKIKIEYNENTDSIKINDRQKLLFFYNNIIWLLILIDYLFFEEPPYDLFNYFLFGYVILYPVFMIYTYRKLSYKNEFSLNEIDSLKETNKLGTRGYRLILKNGKERILSGIQWEEDIREILQLFNQVGIPPYQKTSLDKINPLQGVE